MQVSGNWAHVASEWPVGLLPPRHDWVIGWGPSDQIAKYVNGKRNHFLYSNNDYLCSAYLISWFSSKFLSLSLETLNNLEYNWFVFISMRNKEALSAWIRFWHWFNTCRSSLSTEVTSELIELKNICAFWHHWTVTMYLVYLTTEARKSVKNFCSFV